MSSTAPIRAAAVWTLLLQAACLPCRGGAPLLQLCRQLRPEPAAGGSGAVVTAVSLQPDGHLLASAGDDHCVRLWDVRTGQLIRTLRGHTGWVTAARFAPRGDRLATAGCDGQVLLWDVNTGRRIGRIAWNGSVAALAYRADGRRLAVAGFRGQPCVYPIDADTFPQRSPATVLDSPGNDLRSVAFGPTGDLLAGAGRGGVIRVWDLSRDSFRDIDAHRRCIRALLFTGRQDQLVSAGEDGCLRVWDARSGESVREIGADAGKVLAMVRWNEQQLVTASSDNVIRLWDLNRKGPVATLRGHTGSVAALAVNDSWLASGSFDTTVRVWSFTRHRTQEAHHAPGPRPPKRQAAIPSRPDHPRNAARITQSPEEHSPRRQ